ncbi:MAG: YihY family inner membrane protein [Bacteroidales bacterium]|nr:YihY family inner membrane protein [Bacteroidales bacterium]MCB9013777.1 YihY family inner membrane protein [Bacteroidales bacterium]
MIQKTILFIREGIWKTPLHDKSKRYSFLIRQIRIILLAFRGFMEDRVSMRASALTFYTLLSVVPIAAMGFGVAKGFGFDDKMEEFIIANFKGQEEVMNYIINLSYTVLEDVKGGLLAGIGLVVLVWSVMQVLTNIESSFNAIWQIKKPRPFFRKLSDYLSIMLIAPLLIILSGSASVYISTQLGSVAQNVEAIKTISTFVEYSVRFLPYTIMWILFTLVYMIMPNTKVNFKYALIAGIIAGTVFQVTQWGYIHFQVGVSKYSTLYGTFAALPLFLAWLQISWLIVLLGAEISFAYQNIENYEFEAGSLNISNHNKKLISLFLMRKIIKNFQEGKDPLTSSQLSQELGIPMRLVRDMLYKLEQAKLINETVTLEPRENGYQPALDLQVIDIRMVLDRLDAVGTDQITVNETEDWLRLSSITEELMVSMKKLPSNVLLKDL